MDIPKLHKAQRARKRQSQKTKIQYNSLTPPKYTCKNSTFNTVSKWQKKYGYIFCTPQESLSSTLHQQRQQFQDKAVKYCGGGTFNKKWTRFDKMKMKEQLGFQLEEMPIKRQLGRVKNILELFLKRQGMRGLIMAMRD